MNKTIKSYFKFVLLFVITSTLAGNSLFHYYQRIKPTKSHKPFIKTKPQTILAGCPTINISNILIQPADCNTSDGGIFKISGTGTGVLTYTWYDAKNNVVGHDSTLIGVPAGNYTVTMHDESKCTPVTAGPFNITTNTGIFFNESALKINPTNCSNSDGSITGLTITTAATYFFWVNTNDTTKIIAKTLDLTNVPMGIYEIRAFNSAGCETDSKAYYLGSKTVTPTIVTDSVQQLTCREADGSINVILLVNSNQPNTNWYLLDAQNNQAGYGMIVYTGNTETVGATGLGPGTYRLVIGDPLVCLITLKTYVLTSQIFAIDTSKIVVYNDRCGMHVGAIGGADVIGGTPTRPHAPGQSYIWYDDKGNKISFVKTLDAVGAGRYRFVVTDVEGCTATSRFYTVGDSTTDIKPPGLNTNLLCLPGAAVLSVKNAVPGTVYRFYKLDEQGDTVFVAQNTTGKYTTFISQTTVFFATASDGTCESTKTKATVTVAEPGVIIPTAFTPNGDGVNDYWKISGLEQYPGTTIMIYNRSGKQVYNSIGYGVPFNGTENGQQLPEGVYYYMIDLKKKDCGAASGSLTIIR